MLEDGLVYLQVMWREKLGLEMQFEHVFTIDLETSAALSGSGGTSATSVYDSYQALVRGGQNLKDIASGLRTADRVQILIAPLDPDNYTDLPARIQQVSNLEVTWFRNAFPKTLR